MAHKTKTFLKGISILNNHCGGGQAAKAVGCNPAYHGFESHPPLFFIIMKKILLLVMLLILIIGCAKVNEPQAQITVKEPASQEQAQAKETAEQAAEATRPIAVQEPAKDETEISPGPVSEIYTLLMVGETKAIPVGDKTYTIKLLSASDRAKFLVDSEITKEIMTNGIHVLRDGAEIRLLKLIYNGAEIQIRRKAQDTSISDGAVLSATGPVKLKSGNFVTIAKTTTGWAEITSTFEGPILQLKSFRTEPGPGLYLYLVENNIADGYEVAKLASREGNQQYDLPADLDLNKYRLVAIYSKSEERVYGQATLT